MNWTQPICDECWEKESPDREPARFRDAKREICCLCGEEHESGIYVRKDPKTVPFPREDA